jgi:hypothetical protein
LFGGFFSNQFRRLGLSVGHTTSGGELVQSWIPGAKVVKALNSIGTEHMVEPDFNGVIPDMFIAGGIVIESRMTSFLPHDGVNTL